MHQKQYFSQWFTIYLTARILFTIFPLAVPHAAFHNIYLFFFFLPLFFNLDSSGLPFSVSPLPLSSCPLCHSFCRQTSATSPPPSPLSPSHLIRSFHLYSCRCLSSFFPLSVSHTAVLPSFRPLVFHCRSLHRFYASPSRSNTVLSVWWIYSLYHNCILCRSLSLLPLNSWALMCTISPLMYPCENAFNFSATKLSH